MIDDLIAVLHSILYVPPSFARSAATSPRRRRHARRVSGVSASLSRMPEWRFSHQDLLPTAGGRQGSRALAVGRRPHDVHPPARRQRALVRRRPQCRSIGEHVVAKVRRMVIARVEPVCVIDSVGGHAAKAAGASRPSCAGTLPHPSRRVFAPPWPGGLVRDPLGPFLTWLGKSELGLGFRMISLENPTLVIILDCGGGGAAFRLGLREMREMRGSRARWASSCARHVAAHVFACPPAEPA
jgi:hypothetical protein